MATDYYFRWNHCPSCDRYTKTHMFSTGLLFRAYSLDPAHDAYTPFPHGIAPASVERWRKVTQTIPGSLWDEYGRQHDLDEFWASITPDGPGINWGEQAGMHAWQDEQGFWLTYHDFGGPHS